MTLSQVLVFCKKLGTVLNWLHFQSKNKPEAKSSIPIISIDFFGRSPSPSCCVTCYFFPKYSQYTPKPLPISFSPPPQLLPAVTSLWTDPFTIDDMLTMIFESTIILFLSLCKTQEGHVLTECPDINYEVFVIYTEFCISLTTFPYILPIIQSLWFSKPIPTFC